MSLGLKFSGITVDQASYAQMKRWGHSDVLDASARGKEMAKIAKQFEPALAQLEADTNTQIDLVISAGSFRGYIDNKGDTVSYGIRDKSLPDLPDIGGGNMETGCGDQLPAPDNVLGTAWYELRNFFRTTDTWKEYRNPQILLRRVLTRIQNKMSARNLKS